MELEKVSVELNVEGENNKVVGGNIIHGDAHFHIHDKETEKVNPVPVSPDPPSAGPLDPEVEQLLTKLNLMLLKPIFIEEELTISDLAKLTDDQLSKIGVKKIKHRLAIIEEAKARTCALTGTITLSASRAAARRRSECLGRYVATGEEHEGAPVYRNSGDYILYRYSDGTWRASQHGIGWFSVICNVEYYKTTLDKLIIVKNVWWKYI